MRNKKQGQVSVRGSTYNLLKVAAGAQRKSISQIVEEAVAPALDQYLGPAAQAVDSAPREG